LFKGERIGGTPGRSDGFNDNQEIYDATIEFSLIAKGNPTPEVKNTLKSRVEGSREDAVLSLINQEAQEINVKMKKKK
jgi:hypothetical protein